MKKYSVDNASIAMLKRAKEIKVETAWDRTENMEPQCGFGLLGICCRICLMGPCRIDPFGDGPKTGICGADADAIAARNLARMVAAGTSAHSDHGRDVAHTMKLASEGKTEGYQIKDREKLKALAEEFGVAWDENNINKVASQVAGICFSQFGQQSGELIFTKRAPQKLRETWIKNNVMPRGIDIEVVKLMHSTNMGVDNDYKDIMLHSIQAALADGWGGSMIATELEDVLFGTPKPIRSKVNLGVLKEDEVNILVHGHEPVLSEMIALASQDREIIELAKKSGASGINVAGICCTANEILMRHGIPIAGNFLQQELALLTGAVELLIVDVQCIMPGLVSAAKCFHTKIVSTSSKAKFPGIEHIQFDETKALSTAKDIIRKGIENFKNRDKAKVNIPKESMDLVAGFTTESVFEFLGGKYRGTYRPLNDAIISGRLRGAAAIVGCNNPKYTHDLGHTEMAKELLANDVLLVETGCSAIACAKAGFLKPESIYKYAGKGLIEVCEAVGIPPVLHLGACVDISRILTILCNVVSEGGLGDNISELPVAGAAPEWMSEKAVAIGFYVVASGVYTVLNPGLPVGGAPNLAKFLTEDMDKIFGGKFAFEDDPIKAAHLMIKHIDRKREALKLKPLMYAKKVA